MRILQQARTIAMFGLSANSMRPSHFAATYWRRSGQGKGGHIAPFAFTQILETLQNRIETDSFARFDCFEQGHLEQYLLRCGIAQAQWSAG